MVQFLMARAGGGHGGGGGGGHGGAGGAHGVPGQGGRTGIFGYIMMIVFIVVGSGVGIVGSIIIWKSKFAEKIINESEEMDPLWNMEQMKLNARSIFYRMQDAWENRDMNSVKDIVTPELYEGYKEVLDGMKERGEKNILREIDITDTSVIGCEDYKDDTKDRFIAYIKGTMLDYTILEQTGEIIQNPERTVQKFSDEYHFVRVDNQWHLESIDNSVNLLKILVARNYKEA